MSFETHKLTCPYCAGIGCSECSGTGERYRTDIRFNGRLAATVRGNAPLDAESQAAILEVLQAAVNLMDERAAASRDSDLTQGDPS